MNGWRLNGIEPTGRLTGFDFGIGESTHRAECIRPTVRGFPVNYYRRELERFGLIRDDWGTGHPAPAEHCVCGWRLSKTLYPLWRITYGPDIPGAVRVPVFGPKHRLDDRPVLIHCEGLGTELVDTEDITGETFRYSRLGFTGLALVREGTDPKPLRLWYPGVKVGTFRADTKGIHADWGSNPEPEEYTRARELARYDRKYPHNLRVLGF